jgi:hypothetical protein
MSEPTPDQFDPQQPVHAPQDPALTAAVVEYARLQVQFGKAGEALAILEAECPDLVADYRLGYLPADFRRALSREHQRRLKGRRIGNALLMEATDEDGRPVEAMVVHARPGGRSHASMLGTTAGMVAGWLLKTADGFIVTDTFRWLARLYQHGERAVLLMRGPDDLRQNRDRLVAAGVVRVTIRVRREHEAYVAALEGTGIAVEVDERPVQDVLSELDEPVVVLDDEEPPEAEAEHPGTRVTLAEVDHEAALLTFEAGPVRLVVQDRDDGHTVRRVVIRAHGATAAQRIDLAVDGQRRRFARNAGRSLGLAAPGLADVLADVHDAVTAHDSEVVDAARPVVAEGEKEEAEGILADPALAERISSDLALLGWVGEEHARLLLYLTAISRLLSDPVWTAYRAAVGGAPWQALGILAALMPPEDRLVFHRVSEAVINQRDPRSLRHRVLFVDRAEAIRPEVALALRSLFESLTVSWAAVGPELVGGNQPFLGELRGPVAVLAATAGDIDQRCRECFLELRVDESPAQTARIIAQQRQRQVGDAVAPSVIEAVIARHHVMQRLLVRHRVVIPFADRIVFPSSRVQHRAEHARFLSLVQASALLHQRQRRVCDAALHADEADFHLVRRLTEPVFTAADDSLSRSAGDLLRALFRDGLHRFAMADIAGLMPDWTRWTYRSALEELLDFGYLESPQAGRGRKRMYHLATATNEAMRRPGVFLRDPDEQVIRPEVGGLAEVGEPGSVTLKVVG